MKPIYSFQIAFSTAFILGFLTLENIETSFIICTVLFITISVFNMICERKLFSQNFMEIINKFVKQNNDVKKK